jgi:hypothetical protein
VRILLPAIVGLFACSSSSRPREAKVGAPDTPPITGHGSGRNRWHGGGVYLDGDPIALLRYAELPRELAPIMEVQRKRLPFHAGESIRYQEITVPRYRVVDYLRALGVPLDRVTEVHVHGARDTAIVLTHDDLVRHPDDILFKFASDTSGKPIPIIRNIDVGTSFDDLQALTIYVTRTPPHLTAAQTLELDGHEVHSIPYHGEPLREGVRVYVDDRLVTLLKRNQLANASGWRLADVLARHGVANAQIVRAELIHDDARTATLPWGDLDVRFNEGASGEVNIADQPANAIALYTKSARH